MRSDSARQLDDHEVLAGTIQMYESVKTRTAEFLPFLAEFDRRKLFRSAGYPSAHQFCMQHMNMSEDQAFKYLRAARVGRRFPIAFDMIADGRSGVSAITILSRHVNHANGEELLRASAGMTNAQVRAMLAERFPQPDVPTVMFALAKQAPAKAQTLTEVPTEAPTQTPTEMPAAATSGPAADVSELICKLAVRPVEALNPLQGNECSEALFVGPSEFAASSPLPPITYTLLSPLSPASYALQCTLSAAAIAKLRQVRELLGVRVAPDDLSRVLELAFDALLQQLERTRKAAIRQPDASVAAERAPSLKSALESALESAPGSGPPEAPAGQMQRESKNPRHVPAFVRRAVWARDDGRCQFVSATGRRCGSRDGVELDHVQPVALGGRSTPENLRLLCPAHNQLEAERRFGSEFIEARRRRA